MKVEIENYRGWEISFDTDQETFCAVSTQHDKGETKRSYAAAKKYIDEYIKENNSFKPIMVHQMPFIDKDAEPIKLIGLRKDNSFMYEDIEGQKHHLSSYSEDNYFLVDTENDVHFDRIIELYAERNKISSEIDAIEAKVIKVNVKQIRKNLLGE